jgi:hypothetical protein
MVISRGHALTQWPMTSKRYKPGYIPALESGDVEELLRAEIELAGGRSSRAECSLENPRTVLFRSCGPGFPKNNMPSNRSNTFCWSVVVAAFETPM